MIFTKCTDSALNNCNTNCTFIAFTVSSAVYYILLVIRVKFFSIATEPCVPTYLIHNACTHMFTMQLRWPLTAFVTRLCTQLRLCRCAGRQCVPLHNYVKAQTVFEITDCWISLIDGISPIVSTEHICFLFQVSQISYTVDCMLLSASGM